jgi:tRNA pseudouridine55 synthase
VDGLLLLDKETGPTSHDLVVAVKKALGGARTGHTGTLDPLASGLLVILIGRVTRLAPFVPGDPKVYEGSILLGISTDSLDTEGRIISEAAYAGGPEEAGSALASLAGERDQLPPMYSAVKHRGKPLYRYARRGEEVPRKSRRISVYQSEMTAFRRRGNSAEIDFNITCSSGTYVRELAACVGEMLGCGGAISRLRRLASGPFRVEDAITMDELAGKRPEDTGFILPAEAAIEGSKRVAVAGQRIRTVRNGAPLQDTMLEWADAGIREGEIVAVLGDGELLGMHRVSAADPFCSHAVRIL